ncbi:MAG: diguanylate cyclase [Comamonadaceae bacterium]|nr:MAG: diguanylate cyclase [Comamonadaceae bacterium]
MTRFLNFQTMTMRLILIGVALVALAALGRIYFLGNYLREDISEQSSAQLVVLANYVAREVDHNLAERREFLKRLASRIPGKLMNDSPQLEAWLDERQQLGALFSRGVMLIDRHGQALSRQPDLAAQLGQDLATQEFFQQALKGEFVLGRPFKGLALQVPVLPMALPLRDHSGQVVGVLVGVSALESSNILDALHAIRIGRTGGLVLVSPRDKLFIEASDGDIAMTPTPTEGLYPQLDRAMNGFRGTGIGINPSGVEELTAMASVPAGGWFVMARQPTEDAFAPVTRLQHFMKVNSLLVMVIILSLMVWVVRYLLRPLREAADHADRMTQGELPLEPLPVVRNDEVGHMTVAFNRVLSKLMESRSELEHLAHHDKLTDLPNRQLLADRMQAAFDRAQRYGHKVVVLYLDLDGFKAINDGLGHEAGDAALYEIACRLVNTLRRVDTVARVGGDEFVVLLSDLDDNARGVAERVAAKCLEVFKTPVMVVGQPCRLGVSIGMAIKGGDTSAEHLLNTADQAMYRAKEAGGGCFYWAG